MKNFFDWLFKLFTSSDNPPGVSVSITLPSGYTKPEDPNPKFRDHTLPLSDHFTLGELTHTDHVNLQTENRTLTDAEVESLKQLCLRVMEPLWLIVKKVTGTEGIYVHDAFRCKSLNQAVGGVANSQHPLAQAADWTPLRACSEEQIHAVFNAVWEAAKRGEIEFGQMILEAAREGSGVTLWIHVSLGKGYRDTEKCGEVMTRDVAGKYTLLDRVA